MSVRRLAPKELQPASFTFSEENLAWAKAQITKYPPGRQASAAIAILWRVQEQHEGWVSEAAIRAVADLLEMPYIRMLEIATFYTMFQLQPVGKKAHVQVCGTTPCRLRGAGDLIEVCQIEDLSGLSAWGWDAYHHELQSRGDSIMLVARIDSTVHEFGLAGFIVARTIADELHVRSPAI